MFTLHFSLCTYLPVNLLLTQSVSYHAENIGRCTDGRPQTEVQKHVKERTEPNEEEGTHNQGKYGT
jgi:hypothetical protein